MIPLHLTSQDHPYVPRTTFAEVLELFEATAEAFLAARPGSHGWLVLAGQLADTANHLLLRTRAERIRGDDLDAVVARIEVLITNLEDGGEAVADHCEELVAVNTRLRTLS